MWLVTQQTLPIPFSWQSLFWVINRFKLTFGNEIQWTKHEMNRKETDEADVLQHKQAFCLLNWNNVISPSFPKWRVCLGVIDGGFSKSRFDTNVSFSLDGMFFKTAIKSFYHSLDHMTLNKIIIVMDFQFT